MLYNAILYDHLSPLMSGKAIIKVDTLVYKNDEFKHEQIIICQHLWVGMGESPKLSSAINIVYGERESLLGNEPKRW